MKAEFLEVEISFGGVSMTVSGNYIAGEPQEMYSFDGSGYKGSSSDFEIDSVQINGQEINDLLSNEQFDEIAEKVIDQIEN